MLLFTAVTTGFQRPVASATLRIAAIPTWRLHIEWQHWVRSGGLTGGKLTVWPDEWQPAKGLPHVIILITFDLRVETEGHVWALSFFCDLQNFGVLNRTVVFALSTGAADVARNAGVAQVVHNDLYLEALQRLGNRTRIRVANRLSKLLSTLIFLDAGHIVVLSDLDMRWTQSPLQHLQRIDGEVIGMRDMCWIEMNSGFLVYRPTNGTKAMLHSALGFIKNHKERTDNDQYLLNCALAYHGYAHGLRVRFLDDRFVFATRASCLSRACGVRARCFNTPLTVQTSDGQAASVQIDMLGDIRMPILVWHTSGMSAKSKLSEDQIARQNESQVVERARQFLDGVLFGGWNLDTTRKCLQISELNDVDQVQASLRWRCTVQWHPAA